MLSRHDAFLHRLPLASIALWVRVYAPPFPAASVEHDSGEGGLQGFILSNWPGLTFLSSAWSTRRDPSASPVSMAAWIAGCAWIESVYVVE
ncbi:hypothetical protein BJY59DRAFT_716968 [Rhodotorula toruloides]